MVRIDEIEKRQPLLVGGCLFWVWGEDECGMERDDLLTEIKYISHIFQLTLSHGE